MRRSLAPSQLAKAKRQKVAVDEKEEGRSPLSVLSDHEAFVRSILVKPFKVPIPGYVPSGYGRSLGIRKAAGKRALHDPDAPGALVLYTPEPLPPGALDTVCYVLSRFCRFIEATKKGHF